MNPNKIAVAVKDYLVKLAIEDKLPQDLTQLSITKLEKVIEKVLPSKREEIIARASDMLCSGTFYKDEKRDADDSLSVEEMVQLIAENEDENEIIDYIEGVIVWEKIEYSFTAEQFCEHIGFTNDFYK